MNTPKIVLSVIWLLAVPIRTQADSALTHTSGNVEMAVTDFGSLGAVRDRNIVPNFKFPKSGSTYYLHELSEIWVGDANGNVASAWDATDSGIARGNWTPTAGGAVTRKTTPDGRQMITAQYSSSRVDGFPLNLLVDQQSFSWRADTSPNADDFIVIRLTITNNSDLDRPGIYIALMANWDVDQVDANTDEVSQDWVDWDEERQTLFSYDGDDQDSINPVHTGLTLLDGKLRAHQIFTFWGFDGQLTNDLFQDASRSRLMSDPTATAASRKDLEALGWPPWDYVSIITAGPYRITAKNFVTVTFALVAGEDLADLQRNIDQARQITFAPQQLRAKAISGVVSLEWEASINPSVGGYAVLRRTEGESEFQQVGPRIIAGIAFDDTTVENGVEYTYKIRSVDLIGQPLEFDSTEIRVTPDLIPSPPADLTATLVENQIYLSWTESTEPIGGYAIYRNHTGREPWTQIASIPAENVDFADVNVYPGLHYFYAITATRPSGVQSEFSPVADVAVPQETTVSPESNLDNVIVAPNPYRLGANANPIEFRNLTRRATIHIYTAAGDAIKTIYHRNDTAIEPWDGRNESGDLVPSGIYVYYIESLRPGERGTMTTRGKFAVVR